MVEGEVGPTQSVVMYTGDVKRCEECGTTRPERQLALVGGRNVCFDLAWCHRAKTRKKIEKILLGPPPAHIAKHNVTVGDLLEFVRWWLVER